MTQAGQGLWRSLDGHGHGFLRHQPAVCEGRPVAGMAGVTARRESRHARADVDRFFRNVQGGFMKVSLVPAACSVAVADLVLQGIEHLNVGCPVDRPLLGHFFFEALKQIHNP
jgi:hypothetical protein